MLVLNHILKQIKRWLTWLLMMAAIAGAVYAFTHGAGWVVRILAILSALCFLISGSGLGWTQSEYSQREGRKVEYTLDVYYPAALILATVAVSMYLWA